MCGGDSDDDSDDGGGDGIIVLLFVLCVFVISESDSDICVCVHKTLSSLYSYVVAWSVVPDSGYGDSSPIVTVVVRIVYLVKLLHHSL